jgi:hypothetical protein
MVLAVPALPRVKVLPLSTVEATDAIVSINAIRPFEAAEAEIHG